MTQYTVLQLVVPLRPLQYTTSVPAMECGWWWWLWSQYQQCYCHNTYRYTHTHIVINSSTCHWQQSTSIINSHQWNYCFVVKVSKRKSQYNTIGGRIDKSIIFAWQLLSSVIALNLELFSFVNREGNNFVAT